MGKGGTLSLCAGAKQDGAHGGGHAGADGGNIGLDQLHGVVDGKAAGDVPTGRIQVQRDVGLGVHGGEKKKLRNDDVGHIIVNLYAQEDDAVHHQAAEYIHLGNVQFALLDDGRVDIGVNR